MKVIALVLMFALPVMASNPKAFDFYGTFKLADNKHKILGTHEMSGTFYLTKEKDTKLNYKGYTLATVLQERGISEYQEIKLVSKSKKDKYRAEMELFGNRSRYKFVLEMNSLVPAAGQTVSGTVFRYERTRCGRTARCRMPVEQGPFEFTLKY